MARPQRFGVLDESDCITTTATEAHIKRASVEDGMRTNGAMSLPRLGSLTMT